MDIEDIFESARKRAKLDNESKQSDPHDLNDNSVDAKKVTDNFRAQTEDERVLSALLTDANRNDLGEELQIYDVKWIVRNLKKINQAISKNLEQREKFAISDPLKFMNSEYELSQSLESLSEMSIALNECDDYDACYSEVCSNAMFKEVLQLISTHPNSDIKRKVIISLIDLLDSESIDDDKRSAVAIEHFSELCIQVDLGQMVADFVLATVSSPEGSKVDNDESIDEDLDLCFQLFGVMRDYSSPEILTYLCCQRDFNYWAIDRIKAVKKASEIDNTTSSAMAWLSDLLNEQLSDEDIDRFLLYSTKDDAEPVLLMDTLLVCLSRFRRVRKGQYDVGNAFVGDCTRLICKLLEIRNKFRAEFLDSDGIQLMLRFIDARFSEWHVETALRILDAATMTSDFAVEMIEEGAIKRLLKCLKKGINNVKLKNVAPSENSSLFHTLRLLSRLFRLLPLKSTQRLRLLNVFLDVSGLNSNFGLLEELLKIFKGLDDEHNDDNSADEDLLTLIVLLRGLVGYIMFWILIDRSVQKSWYIELFKEGDLEENITDITDSLEYCSEAVEIEDVSGPEERESTTSLYSAVLRKKFL